MLHRLVLPALLVWSATASAQPSGDAVYRVTFEATWSVVTHPETFPANPHFSWLIGGTHDGIIDFWAPGAAASPGIESMAETGGTAALESEVQTQITAGHAGEVVRSLDYPQSPGSVATEFTLTPETPLLTLVTMIAPSPDWFTGVRGLDLRQDDLWLPALPVDLFPWDAGTDSGTGYTSPDQDTSPAQPITAITGSPFTPGVPVGRFVFELVSQTTGILAQPRLEASASPSPFNPRTTIRYTLPEAGRATVTVHDTRGRLVRSLLDGESAAGENTVTWDGTSRDGRSAPAGVYLVRVRCEHQTKVVRVVLAK